ncbi:hypothetical protein Mapa_006979 [Marchantia paleacea]|nr:hypothetical protein Mapa_006979 [Marchantia paleacea]
MLPYSSPCFSTVVSLSVSSLGAASANKSSSYSTTWAALASSTGFRRVLIDMGFAMDWLDCTGRASVSAC